MITVEWIINTKGALLDEEWEIIYAIIKAFVTDTTFKTHNEGIVAIKRVFVAIRSLHINGEYNGDKDSMMKSFYEVKDIINDSFFDAIYFSYLRNFSLSEMGEKNN